MSDKRGQAQRYAQAAFQAMLERWQGALTAIADQLSKDKALYALLTDNAKPFAERLQAICRQEGLGNPSLEQCVKLVNDENASLRGAIDRAEDGCFLQTGAALAAA